MTEIVTDPIVTTEEKYGQMQIMSYDRLLDIPVEEIDMSRYQTRMGANWSPPLLRGLGDSIAHDGLQYRCRVRSTPNGPKPFEMISGHRRATAMTQYIDPPWEKIPCEVFDNLTEIEVWKMVLIDNFHRQDLDDLEIGKFIHDTHNSPDPQLNKLTTTEIGLKLGIGKTKAYECEQLYDSWSDIWKWALKINAVTDSEVDFEQFRTRVDADVYELLAPKGGLNVSHSDFADIIRFIITTPKDQEVEMSQLVEKVRAAENAYAKLHPQFAKQEDTETQKQIMAPALKAQNQVEEAKSSVEEVRKVAENIQDEKVKQAVQESITKLERGIKATESAAKIVSKDAKKQVDRVASIPVSQESGHYQKEFQMKCGHCGAINTRTLDGWLNPETNALPLNIKNEDGEIEATIPLLLTNWIPKN